MRHAIKYRYAILRYYYTQLHMVSVEGGSVFRPMFYDFPDDPKTYDDFEKNIMIGEGLKVSAILQPGMDKDTFYFPDKNTGKWCRLKTIPNQPTCVDRGSTILDTPLEHLNLHIAPGSVIPYQEVFDHNIKNIEDLKRTPMSFAINLDGTQYKAEGKLIMDQGNNQDLDRINEYDFKADGTSPIIGAGSVNFNVTIVRKDSDRAITADETLGFITIHRAKYYKFNTESKAILYKKDSTE